MKRSKEKQIYYAKYVFVMPTSIITTTTTNATEKWPRNGIEFANFGVYKAWQFSKYYVRRDFILETKTLMGTHWIKRCETCPCRAISTILANFNGLAPHG